MSNSIPQFQVLMKQKLFNFIQNHNCSIFKDDDEIMCKVWLKGKFTALGSFYEKKLKYPLNIQLKE